MLSRKGHSLATWVVIFTVIVTGLAFIRVPLKRALTGKIWQLTDWFFWTIWGNHTDQYKGDDLTRSFTLAGQEQNEQIQEAKNSGIIQKNTNVSADEYTESREAQPGSEVLLYAPYDPLRNPPNR